MLSLNDLRRPVDSPLAKRFFAALKPEYQDNGRYTGSDLFKFGDFPNGSFAGNVCKVGDSFVLVTRCDVLSLDKDYFVTGMEDCDYITDCLFVGREVKIICKAYYLDLNDVFENTTPYNINMGPHKKKLFDMFKETEKEWIGAAVRIRKDNLKRLPAVVDDGGKIYCSGTHIKEYWGLVYKVGGYEYVVRFGRVYDIDLNPVDANLLNMGPLQVVGVLV